ncbi:nucleotide cyclase [Baffinella frigidus]|nr:nucleotide cyclase [Cryptophyta sp. CCMP2293]
MAIVVVWAYSSIMLQCSSTQLPLRKLAASVLLYIAAIVTGLLGVGANGTRIGADPEFVTSRKFETVWEAIPYALLFTAGGLITPITITVQRNGKELARKKQVLQEGMDELELETVLLATLVMNELELETVLLAALVPADIVTRLLNGEALIADSYEKATVLFVYLEDVDTMISRFGVQRTVVWINAVYSAFDAVVGNAATLTKLESFSNFFMVVSFGTASPASDTAAECLLGAVAMMQAVCSLPRPDAQITTLRIGLNTGVVCAGVIGSGSPRYSVFGDTVTAEQLQNPQEGYQSRALVSLTATASQLQNPQEGCQSRALVSLRVDFRLLLTLQPGLTKIKGKGMMSTFALRSTEDTPPSPAVEAASELDNWVSEQAKEVSGA